jgi:hypothetical protein
VQTTSIGHGRQELVEETLDGMRNKKTMRRKKMAMKELGFFPIQTCFIYNQTIMGLSKIKGPKTSMGFYILPRAEDKAAIVYQRQDTCKR